MTLKKRGLGKGVQDLGLSELLSDIESSQQPHSDRALKEIPIGQIQPNPNQPRKAFDQDALADLTESIRQQGILQPLVVRLLEAGHYELIAGERRWRAAQAAHLKRVPAVIQELDNESAAAVMLIENLQREDLNPLEQAYALDKLKLDFGLSHQELAEAIGKSRTGITNHLRLLQLVEPVKEALHQGELEMGHCKALLALKETDQVQAARRVVSQKLSVRQTEKLVQSWSRSRDESGSTVPADPNITQLQQNLSESLGASVKIQHNRQGKGKLVIAYNSLEELDGIIDHIK